MCKLIPAFHARAIAPLLAASSLTALLTLASCATSPLGRKQLMLVGDDQMNQMGAQAFAEVSQQTPVDAEATVNSYVQCVAVPITKAAAGPTNISNWDIKVFKSDEVNAFALPGGHIGVYTGLLKVAKTPGQLAAVLGHETGHVIAKHGAERVSEQTIEGGVLGAVGAFIGGGDQGSASHNLLMSALGLGTQVGIALPHSRTQEAEADLIGEDLMAQAGFDPKESIDLWNNMNAAGGAQPPQWLSDHPANQSRIDSLQKRLPDSEKLYQQAKAQGRAPHCTPAAG
jgi:predicted Zn-dependent protease